MKSKKKPIPMWNRLLTSAKTVATLALFGGLASEVQAQVTYTPTFTNVWVVPAGTYPDLGADANNYVRGIAIDPTTTNVLYASRGTGSNHVSIVSFASGSNFVGSLNALTLSAGTLALEGVRVADDGAVYACNLSGAPASTFLIFRWPNETLGVSPTVVFNNAGSSFQWRAGDYMDVRGSGANTEIVVVGNGSGANITTNFVIFRPTDATCTTFTNFSITIPGGPNTLCGGGVAFEGTNTAIWIRQASSQNTRRITYTPAVMTSGACTRTNTVDQSVCQGLKYYASTNGVQLLATVQASSTSGANQIARVFQVPTSPTAPFISVLSSNIPAVTGSVNGNSLGNVDGKNGYFVFGAPGHGLSLFNLGFITTAPPSGLTLNASGSTFVSGYNLNAIFVSTASGSTPMSNQWYFASATATNLIPGATSSSFTITNVQPTDAGGYFVVITNLYGKATSSVANIVVFPNGASQVATQLWTLAPGSVGFLTGAGTDTQRGMGYDPIYQRLVVVSRSPTNGVHLVDAGTGADQGEMDSSLFVPSSSPPGTYPINMCGVADDGAVFVGNLITSGNSDTFVIYRWDGATNTSTMSISYFGNPLSGAGSLGRIGDTMAVRGAGTNTQILCGFRSGTNVCIFTTSDGANFTPNIIPIGNIPDGAVGLSVIWGPGNTFWSKSDFNLRQVSFDLTLGIGTVLASYPVPTQETIAGVDNANGYAATIGTRETPQNLAIYDITTAGGPSINTLIDRELFAANNPPGNATGAVAMDVAGGRIFALDSNSGILALSYAGRLSIATAASQAVISWPTTAATLQSSTNVTGPYVNVLGATSPFTNNSAPAMFFRLQH